MERYTTYRKYKLTLESVFRIFSLCAMHYRKKYYRLNERSYCTACMDLNTHLKYGKALLDLLVNMKLSSVVDTKNNKICCLDLKNKTKQWNQA